MATLRQRYVDTASSGGDGTTTALSGTNAAYASLQAALNAERANLVSADVYLRIECAADTGTADTTLVDQNIAGWTTDATRYVEIHAAAGHEAGVEWDTSKSTNGASPTPKAYLWNNILSDETTVTAHASATTFINWDNRNHDTYLWNNTLRGALPYGFYGDNGSDRLHYLKNNLAAGVTTAMCLGSYTGTRHTRTSGA